MEHRLPADRFRELLTPHILRTTELGKVLIFLWEAGDRFVSLAEILEHGNWYPRQWVSIKSWCTMKFGYSSWVFEESGAEPSYRIQSHLRGVVEDVLTSSDETEVEVFQGPYKLIEKRNSHQLESAINKAASEGWELHSILAAAVESKFSSSPATIFLATMERFKV